GGARRWHRGEERHHPHLQPGAARPRVEEAHPDRHQGVGERQARAHRQAVGRADRSGLRTVMADDKKKHDDDKKHEKKHAHGEGLTNNKLIEQAEEQMMAITGQKGIVTRSRKSIANFKLRENQPIGVMATLRRDRMFEFLDRLLNIALPRVRDFKGVSGKSFDGKGNYTLGIKEQIIFPEINYDRIEKIKGMNVTIVTTARSDEEGRALLKYFGLPFRTA